MNTKFSEDVVPLTDLKVNPGRVIKHTAETCRPVLLTSRGRGVAVVQSVDDYEKAEEERAFLRAVVTARQEHRPWWARRFRPGETVFSIWLPVADDGKPRGATIPLTYHPVPGIA